MSEEPCRHTALSRRGFLTMAGGSLAGAGLAATLGAAPAGAAPAASADGSLRFATVADTHLNTSNPKVTSWMTQVFAAMARRNPDFVLHCGDITDTGLPDEYSLYASTMASGLHGRIYYSPGNHDVRWDSTAKELYHSHFGPAPYSFDAGNVHFIGVDPTEVLQEPGHYGPGGLAWLESDLRGIGPQTPAIMFQHFPMGNAFYYVDDQAAWLDRIAGHNLRGIIAGHIHREDVTAFNGLTQVALNAVLNGPYYYWWEKTATADGTPALTVTRITVAADGSETETPLTTMPLAGPGQGREQRPRYVHVGGVSGGTLPVTVGLDPSAQVQRVAVQPCPQAVFGGSSTPSWQPLAAGPGGGWSGSVDVSALAPGQQRLEVQALGGDGSWWEQVAIFTVPRAAADPVPRWQRQLPGSVQGGIAALDPAHGTVVAASTGGLVAALGPDGSPVWQARTGPVYRQPGLGDGTMFVPSADHRLYALDGHTGRQQWAFDAGAPVLSAPAIATVGGRTQVLFSAGEALFALDAATGSALWSVPHRGFSSGQAACDGDRVYTAAADGYARAYDARTGAALWQYQMTSGDEHHVVPYSGWDNVVALGGGVAIVASVSSATGLDAATGAVRWNIPGSAMYAPAVILDAGTALLTTEWGVVTRVDLATGTALWQANLGLRVFNAGVAVRAGTAWVLSVDGKLIGVRLSDGQQQGWLQHTLVYTFSRPAIAGDTLVVGDQNGTVHAIRLP